MPVAETDDDMVKYQFQAEDDDWEAWKNTVPRSKSLEKRILELIEADTEGRVVGEAQEQVDLGKLDECLGRALSELPEGTPGRTSVQDAQRIVEEAINGE